MKTFTQRKQELRFAHQLRVLAIIVVLGGIVGAEKNGAAGESALYRVEGGLRLTF